MRLYDAVSVDVAFAVDVWHGVSHGLGDAVILGVTSRVWLTVLEVLPGLVSLLFLPASQRAALQRAE